MAELIAADMLSGSSSSNDVVKPAAATPQPAAPSSTDFSTALSRWRSVQLDSLTTHLSSLSPTLVTTQTEALISRKRLAEQTREFRKLTDEAKPEAIKPLLKAYQAEIDALTNRAKRAENAFLNVADRLGDVPDPYPFLELVLDQMASLQDLDSVRAQAATLQQENAALQSKLGSLGTLESDRSKLSERIATLESSFEARLAERTSALESSLSARWEERVSNLAAREADLAKALELSQTQVKELRVAHARATEREVESSDTSGRMEELSMQMANEDLRRAKERVEVVERRNEQLRGEVEALKSASGEDAREQEYVRKLHERDEEVRRASAALEQEEAKAKLQAQEERRKLDEKDRALAERQREAEALRAKLARMADYDEIRRELRIVKYVEFSGQGDEEEEDEGAMQLSLEEGATEQQLRTSASAKPLEALLVAKNRKLQDEVTTMRVQVGELTTKQATLERESGTLKAEVQRLRELNARLEDDLVNVKPTRATGADMTAEEALAEMERIGQTGGRGSDAKAKAASAGRSSSPAPFNVGGSDAATGSASASGAATPSSATAAASGSRESSILPIITSQRDRFRSRNAELEEELRKQFETLVELRNEVKTLQTDNLGLYEKVRYLQAYSSTSGASSGSLRPGLRTGGGALSDRPYSSSRTTSVAGRSVGIEVGGGGAEEEDKYRARYEASMNPFEAFRGREHSRAVASLNPLERLLHRLLQFVLADRRLRLLFVVYAACLHLLVFAMLWEVTYA